MVHGFFCMHFEQEKRFAVGLSDRKQLIWCTEENKKLVKLTFFSFVESWIFLEKIRFVYYALCIECAKIRIQMVIKLVQFFVCYTIFHKVLVKRKISLHI